MGAFLLFVLFITHGLVGAVELGTDGWIQNITGNILTPSQGKLLFVFTSLLMFSLRFCAHFIEKTLKLSPIPTHGRSFSSLPLEQRQQVLQDWRVSDLRVRRGGYQSLSFAIKLGYFEDDRVRAAAGFTPGCAVPTENRPTGHGGRTL